MKKIKGKSMTDKKDLKIFFAIVLIQTLAANFAHPITPTLLMNLKVSDYMFGLAFAMMAFALFLFSPFWGKMREFFPAKKLLLIGCLGYAFGQFLFGEAKTEGGIVIARLVSGFFVGAIGVSVLIYTTEMSPKNKIAENLAELAIIQALGGSFGYFIGGTVGVYSIPVTFYLQTATLVLCGLLFYFFLDENVKEGAKKVEFRSVVREVNPLKSFLECRRFLTKTFSVILLVILIVTLGSNAFDQAFNYYLKAELNFSSFYNGSLKAITGIVTLMVVSTICMWIIKREKIEKSTAVLLFLSLLAIVGVMQMKQVYLVLGLAVLFSSMNSIINPLLQDIMVKEGGEEGRNMLMGLYNSVKSLGMIIGALFSGFLYGYGPDSPFFLATICFLLAGVLLLFLAERRKKLLKQQKNKKVSQSS